MRDDASGPLAHLRVDGTRDIEERAALGRGRVGDDDGLTVVAGAPDRAQLDAYWNGYVQPAVVTIDAL